MKNFKMRLPNRADIVTHSHDLDQIAAANLFLGKDNLKVFDLFINTLAALHIYCLTGYAFYFYLDCYLHHLNTRRDSESYLEDCSLFISICRVKSEEIRAKPYVFNKVLEHLKQMSKLKSKRISKYLGNLEQIFAYEFGDKLGIA